MSMPRPRKKNDGELKELVTYELIWDPHVNETHIGVAVDGGIVTLTGSTGSYAEKMAAQEAAFRVGVLDVVNNLEIKYTVSRTDAEIAQAVRQALQWNVYVPDECIKSTVANGIVTLEGEVDHWSQLDDAGRAVRNLAGVQNVNNQLQIKPTVASAEVRQAIKGALERHAAREVQGIQLAVKDGNVTLAGKIRSCTERELIVGAVRGTRGVRNIEDRLQVHKP